MSNSKELLLICEQLANVVCNLSEDHLHLVKRFDELKKALK